MRCVETHDPHQTASGGRVGGGDKAATATAHGLSLAAAPSFAIMAVMTSLLGGGAPDMLCAAHGAFPLNDMSLMYLLMSVFHAAPWLKLLVGWRRSARG